MNKKIQDNYLKNLKLKLKPGNQNVLGRSKRKSKKKLIKLNVKLKKR